MYKNYILITVRNIFANKLYSVINIGGLSLGLSVCILMMLFVLDELSYDRWIVGAENIYKIESKYFSPGRTPDAYSSTPVPLAAKMEKYFPEIEEVVQIDKRQMTVHHNKSKFDETIFLVGSDYFKLFDLPMVRGNREQALRDNSSLLISESMAKKYFSDQDPIGQVLNLELHEPANYKIVGVMKDTPVNTHFRADFITLLDAEDFPYNRLVNHWYALAVHTYVKLKPETNIGLMQEGFPGFMKQAVPAKQLEYENIEIGLLPLLDIHLYGDRNSQLSENGNITTVISSSVVAVLVLIIACINFVNLSTARSTRRAKEVSIRKMHGASRKQLFFQFMGEAVILALIALLLALDVSYLVLPWFNEFLQKQIELNIFENFIQLLMLIILTIVVGLLGGVYPAMVLSSFRPARVLRANKSNQEGSTKFRNVLVVLQFSISIILIISVLTINSQTEYERRFDRGFNMEDKLILLINDPDRQSIPGIKQELLKLPEVDAVVMSARPMPYAGGVGTWNIRLLDGGVRDELVVEGNSVGANFFDAYNVKPLAGRTFSEKYIGDRYVPAIGSDQRASGDIVVNESFLKKFNIESPIDAIGMSAEINGESDATIVGVVPDLYFRSLKFSSQPIVFEYDKDEEYTVMSLQINPDYSSEVLLKVKQAWAKMMPDTPIRMQFLKDRFDELYIEDEKQMNVLMIFSLLAILIASLGLYGLASFSAERRTKEIGVRKVYGATTREIIKMLLWQFSKPVAVANVIAWPAAYFIVNEYLSHYAYQVDIYPGYFLMAGMFALMIAWGTTVYHAGKVAMAKPVHALRYE